MSKQKTAKQCKCIDQINEQMKEHNTYVPRELAINFTTGKSRMVLCIPTAKIDTKKRGHAKTIVAAYCPVCGRKIARD